ncbi:competence type IV pilus major pilin ComGC [Virgibacillus byunsanensis]|uniref:ComG operon protein 3 n=1 Tax=Virgibacillus byunsanensis TaxID=570945 RepID=A0ABW3LKX8_9BACI
MIYKNEKGFTLIEMLIVLMIISVLIILIVPNLSTKSEEVYEKGCKALIAVVQAQTDAYFLENSSYPETLDNLVSNNYITIEQKTCPNGDTLKIDGGTIVVDTEVSSPS